MAVLLRSVRANGEPITRALDAAGIPYVVAGMNNLFGTPEAEAARQLFYFMANRPGIDAAALEGLWVGAGLGLDLAAVKQADWNRRRVENVDRALCTIADGYDQPKMKEAISWCWREGSAARNGPEPYLRTAADFLLGQSVPSSSSCTTPRIGNNPIWRWHPFIYLALRFGIKRDPSTRPFIY
jgi:hypothetical protein